MKSFMIFGIILGLIDSLTLSLLKAYNLKIINNILIVILCMVIYSFQPLIFLQSLNTESLTIMNLTWDLISDIFVTGIGLYYFSETLSHAKTYGVILSFISLILMNM